eukprot:TRINITY_DN13008_c0_g1_i1.p1 TRINITY_DN13008_c0_g1~~TRINITY_DN13008_c0_g1_i1.p1  ORF type:complete len:448 (+),score=112.41 TRINITY_DN13008_c0_g1_i1:48-1346(+)
MAAADPRRCAGPPAAAGDPRRHADPAAGEPLTQLMICHPFSPDLLWIPRRRLRGMFVDYRKDVSALLIHYREADAAVVGTLPQVFQNLTAHVRPGGELYRAFRMLELNSADVLLQASKVVFVTKSVPHGTTPLLLVGSSPSTSPAVQDTLRSHRLRWETLPLLSGRGHVQAAMLESARSRQLHQAVASDLPPGVRSELCPSAFLSQLLDVGVFPQWRRQVRAFMLVVQRLRLAHWDCVDCIVGMVRRPVFPECIQNRVPCRALASWHEQYSAPYMAFTQLEEIVNPLYRYTVIAAKNTVQDYYLLAACGETEQVFSKEMDVLPPGQIDAEAVEHRGVFWYCVPDKAVGFSPVPAVCLHYADTVGTPFCRNRRMQVSPETSHLRLSWNINPPGMSTGGWRAGSHYELGDSRLFEKAVLCSAHPFLYSDPKGGW